MTAGFRGRVRLLATATAMLVATGLAGACATAPDGGDGGGGGRTVTALVPTAGAGLKEQYDQYYAALAEKFHADTGATVQWQYFNSSTEENAIVQTSLVSGSGPDVISYGSSFGGTFSATGGFHVLTPEDWDALGGRDAFVPAMLTMTGPTPDEEIGIPHTAVPYVMAYNKALLASAGVTEPPTTWSEFVDVARRVQAANPGVYGAGFDPSDGFDPWKFVWSYTRQLGGDFVSKDGRTAQLDSPQVQAAVDFYFSQFYRHEIVPPDSLSWKNAQMVSAFIDGKVAMLPIATESVGTAAAGKPIEQEIAYAPLPSVPEGMTSRPDGGTPAASIVAGRYWAMPKYAEDNLDLALALIKSSVSLEIQEKQYDLVGWAASTTEGLAHLESRNPESKRVLAVIEQMEPTAYTGAWAIIQNGLSSVITKTANRLAEQQGWSSDFVREQLAGVNDSVQRQL